MIKTIDVTVSPRASVEKVVQLEDGTYKVYTFKPAVEGEANKKVIELVAEYFGVKKSQVVIKAGLKSKKKVVEVLTTRLRV